MNNLISRKQAMRGGLKKYFTGKPCKYGHIAERYLSSGDCIECKSIHSTSDKKKEYVKEYRKQNKEYFKEYRQQNKKYFKEYSKEYNQHNKEHLNKHKKKYIRKRYATDENFKMAEVCRGFLHRTLKSTSSPKESNTYDTIGYCNKRLKESIESKFLEGMSWDNYGEWHIDHIYPISRYVADGITNPAIINSLDNLIPMWASDNQTKNNKTLEEFLKRHPELNYTYGHFLNKRIK